MALERSTKSEGAARPGEPGQPRTVRYTAPAPLAEVMFEQLEYLVHHGDHGCPRGCAECLRLNRARDLLLQAFYPARREWLA